jgi:hypothetical protein
MHTASVDHTSPLLIHGAKLVSRDPLKNSGFRIVVSHGRLS